MAVVGAFVPHMWTASPTAPLIQRRAAPDIVSQADAGSSTADIVLGLGALAAAAAAASRNSKTANSGGFDVTKQLGVCEPLGFWDPAGYMKGASEAQFRRKRELELKHGRVCMVATIGMVVPDLFGKFPGYLSPSMGLKFADIPSSFAAIYKVPVAGWLQVVAVAGLLEGRNLAFPTNYGYPPFLGRINKLEEGEKQKKLLVEINNGRLAMVAFSAMVAQNGVTGQSLVEQFSSGNLNPFIG